MISTDITNLNIEPAHNSTVKITAGIPFEVLSTYRETAIKHLGKDMDVDGFRKGHVPEKVIVDRVGEMAVLTEMAERALARAYPKIIKEHALDAIGYPSISITKIAPDNPLEFTATVAVMPDVMLPDYKTIAKDINAKRESDTVSEQEVNDQIQDVLRQKAAYERLQQSAKASKDASGNESSGGNVTELPTPDTVKKDGDEKEPEVPELTDDLVRTLGTPGQFKDVADFRAKIREHLEARKKQDAISKHRAKLTDAIVEKTSVTLPQVMIDAELNQMFAQMQEDMKRAGITMDDYLAHIQKTKDVLRGEWQPLAEKRAKLQLALNAIAENEEIRADKRDVNHQTDHILEQYKDADEHRVRTYVESVLRNDQVIEMLEKL